MEKREWEALKRLVSSHPSTLLQRDGAGELLLHSLCRVHDLPLHVLEAMLPFCAEEEGAFGLSGRLDSLLHVAFSRKGLSFCPMSFVFVFVFLLVFVFVVVLRSLSFVFVFLLVFVFVICMYLSPCLCLCL